MKNLETNEMEKIQGGGWFDCVLFIPALISPIDAGVLDLFFGYRCIEWATQQ